MASDPPRWLWHGDFYIPGQMRVGPMMHNDEHTNTEVIKAIHQLEIALLGRIHLHTTALELNNQRLKDLMEKVDNQHRALYGSHQDGRAGLLQRMDDTEKTETERKWTVRTVTASFLGLVGKFMWDMLNGV